MKVRAIALSVAFVMLLWLLTFSSREASRYACRGSAGDQETNAALAITLFDFWHPKRFITGNGSWNRSGYLSLVVYHDFGGPTLHPKIYGYLVSDVGANGLIAITHPDSTAAGVFYHQIGRIRGQLGGRQVDMNCRAKSQ